VWLTRCRSAEEGKAGRYRWFLSVGLGTGWAAPPGTQGERKVQESVTGVRLTSAAVGKGRGQFGQGQGAFPSVCKTLNNKPFAVQLLSAWVGMSAPAQGSPWEWSSIIGKCCLWSIELSCCRVLGGEGNSK